MSRLEECSCASEETSTRAPSASLAASTDVLSTFDPTSSPAPLATKHSRKSKKSDGRSSSSSSSSSESESNSSSRIRKRKNNINNKNTNNENDDRSDSREDAAVDASRINAGDQDQGLRQQKLTSNNANTNNNSSSNDKNEEADNTPEDEEEEEEAAEVKIVCVGVMRTGLKTLQRALRSLGYSNIYSQEDVLTGFEEWSDVLSGSADHNVAFRKLFRGCEVVMGMPTFCFWEQICQMYPKALVILTVRDEDDWWASVKNAWSLMEKDMPGAPLRHGSAMRCFEQWLVPSYHKYCETMRFAWNSTLGVHALESSSLNEVIARNSYKQHNTCIEAILESQRRSDGKPRLLVYNVKSGWDPLCGFLKKDVPDVEFPACLDTDYFGSSLEVLGGTVQEMLLPDSSLGAKIRRELRWGLLKAFFALAVVLTMVCGVLLSRSVEISFSAVGLAYLFLVLVAWNVCSVMQNLVLKVPVLVVVPTALKSLLIAGALDVCFVLYDVLKELLVTQDMVAAPVLTLASRVGAILCGFLFVLMADGGFVLKAPITAVAAFAFTNEASSWAGYELLKYTSFPIYVMAKSVKIIPSMMMGRMVNGCRYSAGQYFQAIVALACVALVSLDDDAIKSKKHPNQIAPADEMTFLYKVFMGGLMLLTFWICDSFTSQWQSALYKGYSGLTATQLMLAGNCFGLLFSLLRPAVAWPDVKNSAALVLASPTVTSRIVCLGVVYALGQFCIYSAIRELGPTTFKWLMTARQLLSVLVSLVFFGHGVNFMKVICIFIVFGIMSSKELNYLMQRLALLARSRHLQRYIPSALQQHLLGDGPESKKEA